MANGRGGARPGAGRPRKDSKYELTEFTPEQLAELLSSPHISSVTKRTVYYTVAFKDLFWRRYCDGVDPIQIFEDAGFNVAILGKNRIQAFVRTLRTQYERGATWNDGTEPPTESGVPRTLPPQPLPTKRGKLIKDAINPIEYARMRHKVAYMEQELEFIKKIILAGRAKK